MAQPLITLISISGLVGSKNQKRPPCVTPSEDNEIAWPLPDRHLAWTVEKWVVKRKRRSPGWSSMQRISSVGRQAVTEEVFWVRVTATLKPLLTALVPTDSTSPGQRVGCR